MTEEINPSELGAFTNNLSNKEGIKKLVSSLEGKQEKLTAGSNIAISDENVISATDTKYTAGTNVEISDQNVISATDTVYTAGTGISISEQNVISASGADNPWVLYDDQSKFYDDISTDKDYEYLVIGEVSASIHYMGMFIPDGWSSSKRYINFNGVKNEKGNVVGVILQLDVHGATPTIMQYSYTSFRVGSSMNFKIGVKLYDFETDTEITAANITTYIDSTTFKTLKTLYLKHNSNAKIHCILPIGVGGANIPLSHTNVEFLLSDYYNAIVNDGSYSANYEYAGVLEGGQIVGANKLKFYKRNRTLPKFTTP